MDLRVLSNCHEYLRVIVSGARGRRAGPLLAAAGRGAGGAARAAEAE